MNKSQRAKRILIGVRLPEALREVLEGVGGYVKQQHCNWIIQCVDADEFVAMLRPRVANGAIAVISPSSRALLRRVKRSGVPTVNMFHDVHSLLPSVLSDDREVGALAARYLMARGFRSFAFLGINTNWSRARSDGFKQTVEKSGHSCQLSATCDNVKDYHFMDTARGVAVVQRWIARQPKPVAVLACSDLVVRTLLTACENAGVRVPEEAAIIGVDNRIALCELARVPLSSVIQDFPKLGFEAARLLDRALRGMAQPRSATLVPPRGIAPRRSTEVLAFEDEHISAAMRLIHERTAQGTSMKELLRHIPVSRKWLDLRFKALVGHTPSQEIRDVRLAAVRDMLLQTDFSIRQIAQRCGFSNAENLIRFFRAAEGMPPQKFRERQLTR